MTPLPDAPRFVEVAIPVGVAGTFTYRVPAGEEVAVGCRILVPWGPKLATGFVLALKDDAGDVPVSKVREFREVLDDAPALTPEIIEVCRWASDYYIVPLGEMLKVALPANMAQIGKRRLVIVDHAAIEELRRDASFGEKEELLLDAIARSNGKVSLQTQRASAGAVKRLRARGVIEFEEELRDRAGVRYDKVIVLASPPPLLPPKQQTVVDLLEQAGGTATYAALLQQGASGSSIATMIKKQILHSEQRARTHSLDAFVGKKSTDFNVRFTAEQHDAIEAVARHFGKFAPFLLQGVTGSGKTEVYIELMHRIVKQGKQAIVLVPEIGLTPVLASRLASRFGDRVAILHSNLSASEKYDQWRRAREGSVDIAIGPRSAIFTPFEKLGIIIVDEEGDNAYKQDETPRYNGRDLAVVRAQMSGVPIVLGSATPSLESRANAENGKYELVVIAKRVEDRPLPEVEVIDLRRERGEKEDKGLVIFSAPLRQELERVFAAGEQAIILMNRRGYAPFLLCRQCEFDFRCRDCSVTLTVHRSAGLLICHYCAFRKTIPLHCPHCAGEVLQPIGFGTEKVEERFRRLFPEIPVAVVDRDSTRKRGELVRILNAFRTGEIRAIIGTQIISKGHDFPNVTLTGVINADAILGYPDFRSAEKTFYLLTQVAGRSGRGQLPGKVLIQSAFPTHYAIQFAARHDYDNFFKAEVEFREKFHYPPFTGMIAITLKGEDPEAVDRAANEAGKRVDQAVAKIEDVRVQGPAPAPLARIKGVYRYQILARSKHRAALRRAIDRAITGKNYPGVDVVIDVDPINIL